MMIFNALKNSISEMEQIASLEKAAQNIQKQEKIDNMFSEAVYATNKTVNLLDMSHQKFDFKLLNEEYTRIEKLLDACILAIDKGVIQENTASYIPQELNRIKKIITDKWQIHFHEITDQKIKMLNTVRGISGEPVKVDATIKLMQSGAIWLDKEESFNKLESGILQANQIIKDLDLIDEVTTFFEKVVSGKASMGDLTPEIVSWIKEKDLLTRLKINFK